MAAFSGPCTSTYATGAGLRWVYAPVELETRRGENQKGWLVLVTRRSRDLVPVVRWETRPAFSIAMG